MKTTQPIFLYFVLFVFACSATAQAQSGYIMEQEHATYSAQVLQMLAAKHGKSGDQRGLAEFFLTLPKNDLDAAAQAMGSTSDAEKQTLYIQDQNLRVDMVSPRGKQSMLLDGKSGKMNLLLWDQNLYVLIDMAEMGAAAADAQNLMMEARKNLMDNPQIQKALESLTPEQRDMALKAMNQPGAEVMKSPDQKEEPAHLEPTGRTGVLNNIKYEEYRKKEGSEIHSYLVTKSHPALANQIANLATAFKKNMPESQDSYFSGTEVIDQIPGAVQIANRTWRPTMTGGQLNLEEAISLKRTTIKPEMFIIPSNFKPGTMMGHDATGPPRIKIAPAAIVS